MNQIFENLPFGHNRILAKPLSLVKYEVFFVFLIDTGHKSRFNTSMNKFSAKTRPFYSYSNLIINLLSIIILFHEKWGKNE